MELGPVAGGPPRRDRDARRRRRRLALVGVALGAALAALLWSLGDEAAPRGDGVAVIPAPRRASRVRAPEGVRVRVEVLNATTRPGLARRATLHLRDAGFDVVRTATAGRQSDSTVVLDRTGHPEWARLVAQALGGAQVLSRPDSSGYLDVTVLLGASYRPPAEPFYP